MDCPSHATRLNVKPQEGSQTGQHASGSRRPDQTGVAARAQHAATLWREHRRWIAAILLAHKPREVDLEDLLQTVATAVVRQLAGDVNTDDSDAPDLTLKAKSLKPWLRTVAVNAARAAGRKATVRRKHLKLVREGVMTPLGSARDGGSPAGSSEHGLSNASPPSLIALREEGARLLTLAQELPESYREPLLLRCVKGMSYRQISEVTGLPETTIETRIARGRRMLRQAATKTSEAARTAGPPGGDTQQVRAQTGAQADMQIRVPNHEPTTGSAAGVSSSSR
ncbi:MAG: sigma-70 family RNA polymerase sigma factor [Planctomycetota bacterium]